MINKIQLIGNIGNDPEIKTLESGAKVARISVATNENYKDKNGDWQKVTEWHTVICWNDLASRLEGLKKGQLVYVEGKMTYRKFAGQDGVEKHYAEIVANALRLLERPAVTGQPTDSGPQQPAVTSPRVEPPADDDLPF